MLHENFYNLAAVLTLLGVYEISHQKKRGVLYCIAGNIIWIVGTFIKTPIEWAVLALNGVMLPINIRWWLRWPK